ncbi:hypothetical protein C8R47DRAFT_1328026 [Mycena vitilis]|nr:hypothetical protein C8R47DRAFT_1328026 [Mycena vitilis]
MSDSQQASIWTSYVHAPHGVPTLRDSCAALLSYSLSAPRLVVTTGGSALHPQLLEALSTVLPALETLTRAAAGRRCIPTEDLSCQTDLRAIRSSRTLRRIALAWVLLLQQLVSSMEELERLCAPAPVFRARYRSGIPHFVDSLCPVLRAALPRSVFDLFHIPDSPRIGDSAPRREVPSRQGSCTVKEVLDNGAARRATVPVLPDKNLPTEESVPKPIESTGTHRDPPKGKTFQAPAPYTSLPRAVGRVAWSDVPKTHFKSLKALFRSMSSTACYVPANSVEGTFEPNILQGLAGRPGGWIGEACVGKFTNTVAPISRPPLVATLLPAWPPHTPKSPLSSPPVRSSFEAIRLARSTEDAPRREVPSSQTGRTVKEVLGSGVAGRATRSPATELVRERGEWGITHQSAAIQHMDHLSPSDETDCIAWPEETTPQREFPPRQAGRAVEKIHDSDVTCRVGTTLVDGGQAEPVSVNTGHISQRGINISEGHSYLAPPPCRRICKYSHTMAARYPHIDVCVVCARPELDLTARARPVVIAAEKHRREQATSAAHSGSAAAEIGAKVSRAGEGTIGRIGAVGLSGKMNTDRSPGARAQPLCVSKSPEGLLVHRPVDEGARTDSLVGLAGKQGGEYTPYCSGKYARYTVPTLRTVPSGKPSECVIAPHSTTAADFARAQAVSEKDDSFRIAGTERSRTVAQQLATLYCPGMAKTLRSDAKETGGLKVEPSPVIVSGPCELEFSPSLRSRASSDVTQTERCAHSSRAELMWASKAAAVNALFDKEGVSGKNGTGAASCAPGYDDSARLRDKMVPVSVKHLTRVDTFSPPLIPTATRADLEMRGVSALVVGAISIEPGGLEEAMSVRKERETSRYLTAATLGALVFCPTKFTLSARGESVLPSVECLQEVHKGRKGRTADAPPPPPPLVRAALAGSLFGSKLDESSLSIASEADRVRTSARQALRAVPVHSTLPDFVNTGRENGTSFCRSPAGITSIAPFQSHDAPVSGTEAGGPKELLQTEQFSREKDDADVLTLYGLLHGFGAIQVLALHQPPTTCRLRTPRPLDPIPTRYDNSVVPERITRARSALNATRGLEEIPTTGALNKNSALTSKGLTESTTLRAIACESELDCVSPRALPPPASISLARACQESRSSTSVEGTGSPRKHARRRQTEWRRHEGLSTDEKNGSGTRLMARVPLMMSLKPA